VDALVSVFSHWPEVSKRSHHAHGLPIVCDQSGEESFVVKRNVAFEALRNIVSYTASPSNSISQNGFFVKEVS